MLVSKHIQMSLKKQLRNSVLDSIGGSLPAWEKYPSYSVIPLHWLVFCFMASWIEASSSN